ncbi:hypothetical protein ACQ4PT_036095 [Festuca glaucescens]
MPVRDAVSWNTLLAAYSRSPHPDHLADARRLFDEMPQRDAVTWNTLLGAYVRRGLMGEAEKLFGEMPQRNIASFNTMVTGFFAAGQNGRLDEAEELLTKRLRVTDMDKAVDAYNTLISAYGQVGRESDARRLFDMIPRGPRIMEYYDRWVCQGVRYAGSREAVLEMPDPDVVSWNLIIRGFTHIGEVEHARGFFDKMPERGTISWNTMISGYEQNGDYDGTVKLFTKMLEVGGMPDRHTFSSVLAACASLPMLRLGTQLHQLIEKSFLPDTATSNALITMYSRGGALTEGGSHLQADANTKRFHVLECTDRRL